MKIGRWYTSYNSDLKVYISKIDSETMTMCLDIHNKYNNIFYGTGWYKPNTEYWIEYEEN